MCNLSLGIREEGIAIGDARGICKLVETCQEFGRTKEEAAQKLVEKYGLSEAEAKQRVKKHWKK